jgi:AcrR family transcriptional regulator
VPRPSQEHKILAAALACFAELGYDATRVRHIADRAGVTEGALYRHFPAREVLAQELYRRHLNDYTARLRTIGASGGSAERRLREIIRSSLDSYRAEPDALSFVLLWTPTFMHGLPAQLDYPLDVIEGVVRDGQEEGTIRPGQPNLLAAIFLGCLLRPLMVSRLARPGALDLLGETRHDAVIVEAAWAAIADPGRSG